MVKPLPRPASPEELQLQRDHEESQVHPPLCARLSLPLQVSLVLTNECCVYIVTSQLGRPQCKFS